MAYLKEMHLLVASSSGQRMADMFSKTGSFNVVNTA
jgi:hypothetical protein